MDSEASFVIVLKVLLLINKIPFKLSF